MVTPRQVPAAGLGNAYARAKALPWTEYFHFIDGTLCPEPQQRRHVPQDLAADNTCFPAESVVS